MISSSFRSLARVAPAQLAAALLILYPYKFPPVLPSPIDPILLDTSITCSSKQTQGRSCLTLAYSRKDRERACARIHMRSPPIIMKSMDGASLS